VEGRRVGDAAAHLRPFGGDGASRGERCMTELGQVAQMVGRMRCTINYDF
jgi:hypothetical protein